MEWSPTDPSLMEWSLMDPSLMEWSLMEWSLMEWNLDLRIHMYVQVWTSNSSATMILGSHWAVLF